MVKRKREKQAIRRKSKGKSGRTDGLTNGRTDSTGKQTEESMDRHIPCTEAL